MGPSNVRLSRSNSFHFHAVFSNNFANLARPRPGLRTPPRPLPSTGKSWIRYWQVWGKVIFSQVRVIPSVHWAGGGRVGFLPSMHHRSHDQRGVCIQEGLHPGGSASGEGLGRPPRALQNTVNKRTVRILLECILVVFKFVLVCYEATDMSQCCVSVCRNQSTGHQGSCRSHSSMMIGILEIS